MKQNLIIDYHKERIVRVISNNKVTIIQGGTGVGKSTKIPQYLVESGYRVLITQPRRLAAISLATRVANEMNCSEVGNLVGYNTGIEKCYSSDSSKIIFLTDGLELLMQMFGKEKLNNTVLIIDEIHEWGINVEALIAWSKKQLDDGTDFKLVLMSATLDLEKLNNFFPDASFVQIPSNTYPVTFEHRKANDVADVVLELVKEKRNILVFLPGKQEIRTLNLRLRVFLKAFNINAEILELHGDLEYREQRKVFYHFPVPKIILSTNIAQTSITIPDIDAVVDTGLEKKAELRNGIEGLFLRHISQSDCMQRRGRAGRCKKGKYFLCSDYSYKKRDLHTIPEIYLHSLDELTLRLASIGLEIEDLDFVHTPDSSKIAESNKLLHLLGAFDENNSITPVGKEMARIPLSVRYSRMLIEAKKYDVESDMLIISLLLQIGNISKISDNCRSISNFSSQSDLFYELELFRSIYTDGFDISTLNSMKDININNFKSLIEQLIKISSMMNIDIRKTSNDTIALKKCILSGFIDNLYILTSNYYYRSLSEDHRIIDRNSIFRKAKPKYVIGIPINIAFSSSTSNRKFLTLISRCTSYTLEELLEFSSTLFNVKHSISNDIIKEDLYYNDILIKSKELGSVEYLKQTDPNNFRDEIREIPKFHQTYCYTYYHDLTISVKQI